LPLWLAVELEAAALRVHKQTKTKPKVIVVDDDRTNTILVKMLLELDGFVAETCVDVAGAITLAGPDTDAFVVDYHLARGLSGLALLRAVRKGETAAPPDTIVIITSGDHRREQEAEEAGADLFLAKPYPPDSLSTAIHELVGGDRKNGK
jgi:CheY-like chemotaxis protein